MFYDYPMLVAHVYLIDAALLMLRCPRELQKRYEHRKIYIYGHQSEQIYVFVTRILCSLMLICLLVTLSVAARAREWTADGGTGTRVPALKPLHRVPRQAYSDGTF